MKAWVKGIIAGAVIAVIGIAVLIGGLYMNGWKFPNVYYDFEMRTFTAENGDIKDLKLDIDAGPVRTEFYDGETVTVDYPECDVFGYEITEANGILEVKTVQKSFWHWLRWLPWSTSNIPATVIKLPQNKIYDLQIYLDAGMITLADGNYGKLNLDINAGTVKTESIACADFNIDMAAGTVNAGKIVCDNFGIDLAAGTVTVRETATDKLNCDISAGTVSFKKIQSNYTSIEASAGTVNAAFTNAQAEYNINVNKSAGTCNVKSSQGTTDKTIKVRISAGTVKLTFAEA